MIGEAREHRQNTLRHTQSLRELLRELNGTVVELEDRMTDFVATISDTEQQIVVTWRSTHYGRDPERNWAWDLADT